MANRHIAIFTQPSRGHLYPVLELCMLLIERGYHVTCAITENLVEPVLQAGAQPVVYSIKQQPKAMEKWRKLWGFPHDPEWWDLYASDIYPWLLNIATDMVAQLQGFYADNSPSLVLYDRLAFAGRIIANKLGTKAVQIYPHFAFYRDLMHRERGVCVNPTPMLRFAEELDSYLFSHGIRTVDNLWHTEELNIYFIPRDFQHHASCFDERFCFVGACVNRPFKHMWTNTSDGKPIILVSSMEGGSNDTSFFKALIESLSGLEYHVVLSTNSPIQNEIVNLLPPNFEVSQHVSQLELLEHAALIICHAGTGTTLEAIYNGVPVIASPVTPPTAEVAYRVVEMGVGIALPRDQLTADFIRTSVRSALTDSSIHDHVKEAQHTFRCSGGAMLAADKIERFLQ